MEFDEQPSYFLRLMRGLPKLTEYSGENPPGQGNTCADSAVKAVCAFRSEKVKVKRI